MVTPRFLNESEIEDILTAIPEPNAAVTYIAKENHRSIQNTVRKQLSEIKLNPEKISVLKNIIYNRCLRASIHPGENAGYMAAESIGQPISQANLNSFHVSGSKENSGEGIKKFNEVLSLSKNRKRPKATIHLKDKYLTQIDAINLSKAFLKTQLNKFLLGGSTSKGLEYKYFSSKDVPPFYKDFGEMMKSLDRENYENFNKFVLNANENSQYLRLNLNMLTMFHFRVTTRDIAMELEKIGGIICVFSPTVLATIDIYTTELSIKNQENLNSKILSKEDDVSLVSNPYFQNGIITPENQSMLFIQICFLPEIYSNNIYIKSSIIRNELNKKIRNFFIEEGSDFKNIEVKEFNLLQGFRGETKRDGKIYLWVNDYICNLNGVDYKNDMIELLNLSKIGKFDYDEKEKKFIFSDEIDSVLNYLKTKYDAEIVDEKTLFIRFAKRYYFEGTQYNPAASSSVGKMTSKQQNAIVTLDSIDNNISTGNGNILTILRRMRHFVDFRYTITNNFHEVNGILGLEAARFLILIELTNLIGGPENTSVNPVHVKLIADSETNYGSLIGFTAISISNKQLGVYYESSFEQALQNFKKAALSGKEQLTNDLSSSILFGKRSSMGTGSFKIIAKNKFDFDLVESKTKAINDIVKESPLIVEEVKVKEVKEDKVKEDKEVKVKEDKVKILTDYFSSKELVFDENPFDASLFYGMSSGLI